MKTVNIYTDGACSGNPGPGGYGAILVYHEYERELSEGFAETTNNRMELLGAIKALELLKEPCRVLLTSDSKYLVDGINLGWAKKWKSNNWFKPDKKKAQNISTSVDVRGKNLEDAVMDVEKYIDDAYISGLNDVTIIHGRGEGILRKGIHDMLKRHKNVKEFRIGGFNEGGDGVTVIKLK